MFSFISIFLLGDENIEICIDLIKAQPQIRIRTVFLSSDSVHFGQHHQTSNIYIEITW